MLGPGRWQTSAYAPLPVVSCSSKADKTGSLRTHIPVGVLLHSTLLVHPVLVLFHCGLCELTTGDGPVSRAKQIELIAEYVDRCGLVRISNKALIVR